MKSSTSIWYESERPQTVDDMVLPESIERMAKDIIAKRDLPHMIFASTKPGTGKTTLARAICNQLGYETLFINASEESGIDLIRDKLRKFCSSFSLDLDKSDGMKAVIFDEADMATSPNFMSALRGFIEEFQASTRFIMTCNYLNKIPEPIQSRMTVIEFKIPEDERIPMMKKTIARCLEILDRKGVEVSDKRVIAELTKKHYPNNRSILNDLQRYAKSNDNLIDEGILTEIRSGVRGDQIWQYIKAKDFKELRQLAVQGASDYPAFIRDLYETGYNLIESKDIPVMIEMIGESQKFEKSVADLEIHVTYLMMQLMLGIKNYK